MGILDKKYYYFIGAGGIGMSALERFFNSIGKVVLGYDKTPTELTSELIEEGIDIHFKDNIDLIPSDINQENTLVVYTPAIPKDHKELNYFFDQNFEVLKRSEVLGAITRDTYAIGVAGTHGKTTTSSILGHILKVADLDSTAFLGGIAENYNSNIISNGSKYTVSEADEFDRSFLRLSPKVAIITSDDADHLDIYGERDEVKKSFQEFASIVEEQLFVRKGLEFSNAKTYGVNEGADYDAVNVRIENGFYIFDVVTPNGVLKDIYFMLPGRHNMENATAAIAVADFLGISGEKIQEALQSFVGVRRRFNRTTINGKIYIDDYAHHPTELDAVINSLRELYPGKKILGVFQPHLFTRTRDFATEFAQSLSQLDELMLLDIYPARELPIEGITSNWLLEMVDLKEKEVYSLDEVLPAIKTKDFDVLLTVGAGNIDTIVKPIKNWLNSEA
ncbi:UDP-N-acetylmuramate--L-alanine ligase [Faecalibacter bovis]|uniref:UDP-N-acetylmuramate--L-alanine ligase n=1 Tax=Faecalibacter bovis TaxID=2898187 RepID=A0ABX7XEJ4_9FLAO|nr:UDP-N-acetylmuramate--L-alanine ligase [Faecalibacter bovis]QTV06234.1 UDP-N-acetylmuramate--L-alanine ligase [Faecalibacter bovis]